MCLKKYDHNINLPNNYASTVVRIEDKGKIHLGNDLLIISPLKYNHQLSIFLNLIYNLSLNLLTATPNF